MYGFKSPTAMPVCVKSTRCTAQIPQIQLETMANHYTCIVALSHKSLAADVFVISNSHGSIAAVTSMTACLPPSSR